MVYSHYQGVSKKRISALALLLIAGLFAFMASIGVFSNAKAMGDVVVYDAIDAPIPKNVVSLGFEATSTSEFGDRIQLEGTSGLNPKVTVLMSSWACENGHWNNVGTCNTNVGSYFTHDITLKVYNVGNDGSVGSNIVSKTQSFEIPFRPSADSVHCDGKRWWDGTSCYSGLAVPITFDLAGLSNNLPEDIIITVAYNTTHYGADPIGESATCYSTIAGCGYDSLNVGIPSDQQVYTGNDYNIDETYWDTTYYGYTSGLKLDNDWSPNGTLALQIENVALQPKNVEQCKKGGWTTYGFRNQGLCIQYVNTAKDSR